MTPNIAKGFKDTGKFAPEAPDHVKAQANDLPGNQGSTPGNNTTDGDHAAKAFDSAATSAAQGGSDLTEGLHETSKMGEAAGTKETGGGTSIFSKHGAVGSAFNADGAIGGTAEKVGGPFSQQGAIGKQFTAEGGVGGTFQKLAEKNEQH